MLSLLVVIYADQAIRYRRHSFTLKPSLSFMEGPILVFLLCFSAFVVTISLTSC
jgi:hypothetical protein